MTFGALNSSVDQGGPIQLFRFTYGESEDQVLAYTSALETQTVDHGGSVGVVNYEPVPVERDAIVSNGTLDRSALAISLDVGTDIAELFRIYPPSSVVNLVIYEGHVDDPDGEFVVIWSGRIVSATREGSTLRLSGEPISTQLRRSGLRRHYQYGCPHALYGPQCGADKASATVTGTVASISGNVVTLEPGWEGYFDRAKFLRGTLEWTPYGGSLERRAIIKVDDDALTLSGAPLDLAATDPVDVVLGCNHRAFAEDGGDCEGLHDNIQNFGGQPWIPLTNVINRNPFY